MIRLKYDVKRLEAAQCAPLRVLPEGAFFFDKARLLICIVRGQDMYTTLVEPWYDCESGTSMIHYDGTAEVTSCVVKMMNSDYVTPLAVEAACHLEPTVQFSPERFFGQSGQLPAFASGFYSLGRGGNDNPVGLYVRRRTCYEYIGALPGNEAARIPLDHPVLCTRAPMFSESAAISLIPAIHDYQYTQLNVRYAPKSFEQLVPSIKALFPSIGD